MNCEKFVSDLLFTDIAFLLQTGNSEASKKKVRYIYCMQIKTLGIAKIKHNIFIYFPLQQTF